jgi:hypothetical protein
VAAELESAMAGLSPRQRRSVEAKVMVLVRVFLERYAARPPWRYVATELALGDCVADGVLTDGARWRIDEIKTGSVDSYGVRVEVADQLARLLRAGRERWGDAFLGVRLVALGDTDVVREFQGARDLRRFVETAPRAAVRHGRGGASCGLLEQLGLPGAATPREDAPRSARTLSSILPRPRSGSGSGFTLTNEQAEAIESLGSVRIAYVLAVTGGLTVPYERWRQAAAGAGRPQLIPTLRLASVR